MGFLGGIFFLGCFFKRRGVRWAGGHRETGKEESVTGANAPRHTHKKDTRKNLLKSREIQRNLGRVCCGVPEMVVCVWCVKCVWYLQRANVVPESNVIEFFFSLRERERERERRNGEQTRTCEFTCSAV